LKLVMTAGEPLPPDKRSAFLARVAGYLQQTGYRHVRDRDVERATMKSLKGLLHAPAA
jgi:hypothetical protein